MADQAVDVGGRGRTHAAGERDGVSSAGPGKHAESSGVVPSAPGPASSDGPSDSRRQRIGAAAGPPAGGGGTNGADPVKIPESYAGADPEGPGAAHAAGRPMSHRVTEDGGSPERNAAAGTSAPATGTGGTGGSPGASPGDDGPAAGGAATGRAGIPAPQTGAPGAPAGTQRDDRRSPARGPRDGVPVVPAEAQRPPRSTGAPATAGQDRHTPAGPGPGRRFAGRRRELKALHEDVERAGLNTISGRKEPRARVLLIAGRPGAGRTALAEEIAGQLHDGYPDGVVRARLTETGGGPVPTERTAREILRAFGIATPPGAGEDELSEMVRAALARRRVLLLLDDAVDAAQVDPLVPDNPDCLVIAVAQGPLTGIPDVRPCTVGGMDAKAAIELLGRFTGAVRITVDPQAAESLAEECSGQPAALVLAGGWLAARPTASVADAAKRLRAVPEDRELPVGDRPLARAFRLVHETLPGPAARILRLLALAPAGFVDAHTASALAGCSVLAARAALDDLVARGLLRVATGEQAGCPATSDQAGGGRAPDRQAPDQPGTDQPGTDQPAADQQAAGPQYEVPGCLFPLLRALLTEKERPAEVQLARARMLERTVRLLQSCRAVTEPEGSPARKKPAGLPRALRFPSAASAAEWLRVRQHPLLASARVAVADGGLDTLARRLVAALVRALAAHQGTEAAAPELYGLHELVLGIAERRALHREQAAALLNIGDLDSRTGRTHDALARYRAALDAGKAANDLYATGRAMESVGGAYQDLEDWQRAADWYGRALSQRLSRGERADEARLYGRLGVVHTCAGHYGEALRSWRAAAAGYRRLSDLPGQARALSEVARVQECAGRPHESLRTCQEATEWARLAGDRRLEAALQLRLADTLDRLGDPIAALLHRGAAERLLEADGSAYEIRSTTAEE